MLSWEGSPKKEEPESRLQDFLQESRALWSGPERTTRYLHGRTLKPIVSAGDVALAGVASINVNNPAPGGGDSNVKTFAIREPVDF